MVNGYWVCVEMGLADGPLNIIWMLMMCQVDNEQILGLCRDGSGGWTTEYYLDVIDGLGGQSMNIRSVQRCVQWMDH